MTPQTYYEPTERGFEARVAERMRHWAALRSEREAWIYHLPYGERASLQYRTASASLPA